MTQRITFADAVVAALSDARELLTGGHCQGVARLYVIDMSDEVTGVCYCAVGALAASCRTVRYDWHTYTGSDIFDAALTALRAELPAPWSSVSAFNDASSITEVLRLYQRAIDTVRAVAA